jgi:hypothetical protein
MKYCSLGKEITGEGSEFYREGKEREHHYGAIQRAIIARSEIDWDRLISILGTYSLIDATTLPLFQSKTVLIKISLFGLSKSQTA